MAPGEINLAGSSSLQDLQATGQTKDQQESRQSNLLNFHSRTTPVAPNNTLLLTLSTLRRSTTQVKELTLYPKICGFYLWIFHKLLTGPFHRKHAILDHIAMIDHRQ
jgi:hypothetical protein